MCLFIVYPLTLYKVFVAVILSLDIVLYNRTMSLFLHIYMYLSDGSRHPNLQYMDSAIV